MPTYYDHGLGIDTTSQIVSSGDELAAAANYTEPENVDYGYFTWENQPISKTVAHKLRDEDFPQLSSPSINITIPSGSPHNIYDSTNTTLISGNADENNDREFTLDYSLTGVTISNDDLPPDTVWSFTTPELSFGSTTVRTNIVSGKGPSSYDSVIISRTPTQNPNVVITTPATDTHNIYDSTNTVDIIGTASDPNSLSFTLSYDLSGATTGDGIPTGTSAWNFTTPILNFGNTRANVDITNSWNLSANDNLIISRTPTLPPVVTITTETSATTASEITIDGTASDPNSLSFTVTYEISGAKTDSGTATGTTDWTLTEGLSAGNNRFDVTATNTWNLVGSDSLIVTYSPPGNGGAPEEAACTGDSWDDDFDSWDDTLWTWDDIDGQSRFNNSRFEFYNPGDGAQSAYIQSVTSAYFSGDLDICVSMSVDSISYSGTGGANMNFYLFEGGKGAGLNYLLEVQGPGDPSPGSLMHNLLGQSPWYAPPGGLGAGSTHIIRFTRIATTGAAKFYVWNSTLEQWEWNGDTDGLTLSGFDQNLYVYNMEHNPIGGPSYILGGFDYIRLNVGTQNFT